MMAGSASVVQGLEVRSNHDVMAAVHMTKSLAERLGFNAAESAYVQLATEEACMVMRRCSHGRAAEVRGRTTSGRTTRDAHRALPSGYVDILWSIDQFNLQLGVSLTAGGNWGRLGELAADVDTDEDEGEAAGHRCKERHSVLDELQGGVMLLAQRWKRLAESVSSGDEAATREREAVQSAHRRKRLAESVSSGDEAATGEGEPVQSAHRRKRLAESVSSGDEAATREREPVQSAHRRKRQVESATAKDEASLHRYGGCWQDGLQAIGFTLIGGLMKDLFVSYDGAYISFHFQLAGGNNMLEQVGQCYKCRTTIVCRDGFLDGIVLEDQRLICFPCSEAGGVDADENEGLGGAER